MRLTASTLVTRSQWTAQRWKNGAGLTHEIWRWRESASPAGLEHFDLRLSVAELEGAQPFSLFPGYDRALIPLEDSALTLELHGIEAPIIRHRPFHFAGEVVACTRGLGRASDLNVMSWRARGAARVEVGPTHAPPEPGPLRKLAIFALEPATVRDGEGDALELAAHDTLIQLDHRRAANYAASAPVVWIWF